MPSHLPTSRTIALTTAAMLAFAANSVLCRLALSDGSIDPASFTFVRIASGALTLWTLVTIKAGNAAIKGSWPAAAALFAYAITFAFAYVSLPAGTGALILFGAVQATMITTGIVRGERLSAAQTAGLVMAFAGLVALLAPGSSAPPALGAILMLTAGAAWGAYSLLGRGATDPLAETTGNFLRALPMAAIILAAAATQYANISGSGVLYAILSGAVASGMGYAIWYAALPGLSPPQGASVQLSVPVITAIAGTLALGEAVTLRLAVSSLAILGGIALVISSKPRPH